MFPRLLRKAGWTRTALPLLFIILPSFAQAERLPLKPYTVADGLPNNVINKIVRDSRGFLWFCTAEGLSLFDGYGFTNYGRDEGLPHPNVTDILETRVGDYWVATNGGLVKFNPNGAPSGQVADANGPRANAPRDPMFTVFTPDGDDRYTRSVTTLLEGRDGTIWCGTRRGLFRLEQANGRSAITLVPVDISLTTEYPQSARINALLEDGHGTLWVGANSGLYRRWQDGSTERYGTRDGLPAEDINALLENRQGNLWVGTPSGGLFQLAAGAGHQPPALTRSYNRKNGLTTDWVFDLYESSDNKLWVGTNLGLVEFADDDNPEGPLHVFTKRHGFSFHEILNVTEDRVGNLWLGTINGAMKLATNGFVTFGEQDGIYMVNSLFESRAGELYAYGFVLGDQKARVFDGGKLDILNPGAVKYWFSLGRFDGERFTWLRTACLSCSWISACRRSLRRRRALWKSALDWALQPARLLR
jgi:ligand-binding sensor domain-containing protein